MRDHRKLRVFSIADRLTVQIYRATASFPKTETFGLSAQMRRASISVPSNIVEGCARKSKRDYLRFLYIAYGSSRELEYHVHLALRLGYLDDSEYKSLNAHCVQTSKHLNRLIRSIELNSIAPVSGPQPPAN